MYCTNCGRKIKDGERYCPYCGTKTFNEYEFNQQLLITSLKDYLNGTDSGSNYRTYDLNINCYVWNLWTLLALLSC